MPVSRTSANRVAGTPTRDAAPGTTSPSADGSRPAAERRTNVRRFWAHHPALFVVAIAAVAFTEYMRWRDLGPGDHSGDNWYTALCGVLCFALGVYVLTPSGTRKQAEYNRDPNRSRAWFPVPKSVTGVRVMGGALVVVGIGAFAASM